MSTATELVRELTTYLSETDQSDLLPEVVRLLQKEADRHQEIAVISAIPLAKEEQHELTTYLQNKWGDHPVVFTVDDILVSGLIVQFRDTVLDLSGREQLRNLQQALQ